jgi:hypothetical protein
MLETDIHDLARPRMSTPHLDAYLAGLPAGLASHPECQQKASIIREFLADCPALLRETRDAPEPVRALLVWPPPLNAWVSEVVANAAFALARDLVFPSDDSFGQAVFRFNRRLFDKAMYRLLMALVSPSRMITLGASRWSAFHRGSHMSGTILGRSHARVDLGFPTGLFGAVHAVQYAAAVRAAMHAAHADSCRVTLERLESTHVAFAVEWKSKS